MWLALDNDFQLAEDIYRMMETNLENTSIG